MLKSRLTDFKSAIPLMESLKNDSLRNRHWQLLMKEAGYEFRPENGDFQMEHIFNLKLYSQKVNYRIIID